MKKFLKNKFVVLTIIVVFFSIIYAWTNKAIKQYNFTNNEDIITEEKWEENFDEETNLGVEESGNDKDEEGDGIESDDSENGKEGKEIDDEGENDTISIQKINVYITGEVNVPGVVILNENSRIIDAINSAGGPTTKANISKVNLAYVLKDGMKVNIPNDNDLKNNPNFEYITMSSGDGRSDEHCAMTSSGNDSSGGGLESGLNAGDSNGKTSGSSSAHSISLVNINTATQTELETLPGIGPSIALKIINYRKENGKFAAIEDIKNVSGIGDSKFETLKKYITV